MRPLHADHPADRGLEFDDVDVCEALDANNECRHDRLPGEFNTPVWPHNYPCGCWTLGQERSEARRKGHPVPQPDLVRRRLRRAA